MAHFFVVQRKILLTVLYTARPIFLGRLELHSFAYALSNIV